MGPLALAAVWLAACVDVAQGIAEKRPNAVRDGVKLVWEPPSWTSIPDLYITYCRGRQVVYDAISNLQRQAKPVRDVELTIEGRLDDTKAVIRRALALSRL